MVLALVLLPALATVTAGDGVPTSRIVFYLLVTLAKVSVFVAIMLIVGRRLIPWLMHHTARTGSRELFRLAVYAIALGVAFGAAKMFGVSFALGAFFAGMVMGESDLSQRATEEAMPLRDAFAVLFFVSVGMLLNPMVFVEAPLAVLATVAIIVIGKSAVAYLIVRAFRHSNSTALTVAASLAQIGEFSFILIGLGMDLDMVPKEARDLVLAGAIVSIILNPLAFILMERLRHGPARAARQQRRRHGGRLQPTSLSGHDILIGYGRVGSLIGQALAKRGVKMVVIETSDDGIEKARQDGAEVLVGNGADPDDPHRRQCRRRAAPVRDHSRAVRGGPGRPAGARRQSDARHPRPRPCDRRGRSPEQAWREPGRAGRSPRSPTAWSNGRKARIRPLILSAAKDLMPVASGDEVLPALRTTDLIRRTDRAGLGPGAHGGAELGLGPGGGRALAARRPGPADQRVLGHVLQQGGHVETAVARRVLDLATDLAQRLAGPRHRRRRQMPFRMAGHTRLRIVRRMMAGIARQARRAVPVGAAHHERHVRRHAIGLRGPLAHRMAVEAARVLQDLAGLAEQLDRSRRLVGLLRHRRRNKGQGANRHEKADDHLGPSTTSLVAIPQNEHAY